MIIKDIEDNIKRLEEILLQKDLPDERRREIEDLIGKFRDDKRKL